MLTNLISVTAESPCTGHCSTVLGDDVCRSCKRTFDEIIAWPTITDAQRIAINQRVARLALTTSPLTTHQN
ncbi:MAG: DUF1289 domain-containing protein [Sideroxydans sp.]|nr:DUF1289 domain-containing protein [Sideroxydans sp.]